MKRFFLFWGIFLFCLYTITLKAQNQGKAFTRSYLPQEYHAETQNWAILQDHQGIVYVGNGSGILRYDGVKWDKINLPNNGVVRSLAISPSGKIYVGGSGEIGYLTPNQQGKVVYVSLVDKIPEEFRNFKYIWSVIVRGENDIIFQGNTHFFHFKDGKIKGWNNFANLYHRAFLIDKKIFVRGDKIGLCEFTDNGFKQVKNGDFFKDKTISALLPHPSGKQLIGTRKNGFFLMDLVNNTGETTPFQTNISQAQVYHGILLRNGNYAFCTLSEGFLITDSQLNVVNSLSEMTDLKATPYFAYEDQQGSIWIGLAKGMLRAEMNQPITFFGEVNGLRGLINDVLEVGNRTYVCAGEGVFYIENGKVYPVEGLSEQAWFIEKIPLLNGDSTILFAEDKTIYELLPNGKSKAIYSINHTTAYAALASKKFRDKGAIWIGYGDGLGRLTLGKNPSFKLVAKTHEIRHILEDWEGNLWLCTYQNGILKAEFPDKNNLDSIKITEYDKTDGLSSLRYPYVFKADGQILFGLTEGIFQFDEKTNRFIPSDILGKKFQKRSVFHVTEDNDKNLWITGLDNRDAETGVAEYKRRNRYKWYDIPFRRIPQMLESKVYVSKQQQNIIWIGGSEGLFRYEVKENQNDLLQDFHALISEVKLNEDSILFHGTHIKHFPDSTYEVVSEQDRDNIPKFNYDQNSLIFEYSATSYDYTEGNEYAHLLEPYDKDWVWGEETKKEYTNLPAGNYVFHVKARNIYGKESFEAQYAFSISPPWYRMPFAYVSFVAILFGIIWLSVVLYTKRLRKEKEKLEFIVEARTSEVKRKNEVLEEQKTQLAQAVGNISALNDIGQKITSSLELEQLVQTIYTNVNKLADASVFGVGSYNPIMQSIEFKGYIENGQKHSYVAESLDNEEKFSVWCFNNQKEIIINNLETEYSKYLNLENYEMLDQSPKSLIYVPLVIDKNPVGVLTLQSYQTNAYENMDITVLRSLASYVAIALENAKSYEVIKENNRKITDSIRYAKTIQNAILPTDAEMEEAFQDFFIIYKPKDIVSGDFFWISHTPKRTLLAVVDCTGHGVPGAFMSMVGTDLLTEIVNTQKNPVPFLMLEKLDIRIQEALRQNRGFNNDGMDICMVLIEYQKDNTVQVSFTGAKRPLYYFDKDKNELEQLRGDKKSVGGIQRKKRNFTNQTIFLENGDLLYLSSDGIVDQPDNQGVKFGTPYFQKLLTKNASLPLENQKDELENSLTSHMEQAPQRDDISVIGIRL